MTPTVTAPDQLKRWTPEIEAAIVSGIEAGLPAVTAAVEAGIPRRTWEMWSGIMAGRITHYHDGKVSDGQLAFLAHVADVIGAARAKFEAKVVRNIAKAAESVNEKTGIPEWRAGAWLMNNHPAYRQDYREHKEVRIENVGTVAHEHRLVREMEAPQLLEVCSPEIAALMAPEPES